MRILAIDMGKFKSVSVDHTVHDGGGGPAGGADETGKAHETGKVETPPAAFHDLLVARLPDRLVIEAGPAAGWVCDLAEALGVAVQVANTNDERWHWKRVKCKTDQRDAVKLAQLSALGCLPTVHVPAARVRQWRSFIEYRHALVGPADGGQELGPQHLRAAGAAGVGGREGVDGGRPRPDGG